MKIISKKKYSERERKIINNKILNEQKICNKNNHCTNPSCEFYKKDFIKIPDEETCPLCGENTTYFYSKTEDI